MLSGLCGLSNTFFIFPLQGLQIVSFDDWERIDQEEIKRGKVCGKPREKFTDIHEMLSIVKDGDKIAANG